MPEETTSKAVVKPVAKKPTNATKTATKKTSQMKKSTVKKVAKRPQAIKKTTKALATVKNLKRTENPSKQKASKATTKKARKPRKETLTGFDELFTKQAELAVVTKKAKTQLRKEYADAVKKADAIKDKYRTLFGEKIDDTSVKLIKRGHKIQKGKGITAPITKAEVESFIEQKEQGLGITDIKIKGRRIKTIKRISDVYNKADTKEPRTILALLQ